MIRQNKIFEKNLESCIAIFCKLG